MVGLVELWLAILLSAVFVFLVSSVLHMMLPIHKKDYSPVPNEDDVRKAMRDAGLKPGNYMFPHCDSMKELGSPEMIAKFNEGPVGNMVILPNGPFTMGKALGQWFVFSLFISMITAYLCTKSLIAGASFMDVFQVAGTVGILGHALTHIPDSIWKGLSWCVTARFIFDGLVYGLVTGATFAWLWPAAA